MTAESGDGVAVVELPAEQNALPNLPYDSLCKSGRFARLKQTVAHLGDRDASVTLLDAPMGSENLLPLPMDNENLLPLPMGNENLLSPAMGTEDILTDAMGTED